MSRSGYCDDYGSDDPWSLIRYRGAVTSAKRGKRGQKLFRDLLAALDAMPEKKLVANVLEDANGCVCALGALGKARGIEMDQIDPEQADLVSMAFDIAECLAREVVYVNDEWGGWKETPEARWSRMRKWVASQIKDSTNAL